jgi:uncharacterized protein YgbK (DUF1537 family)
VPIRLGLVADDVTGAGDASVQFAKRGWDTFLILQTGSDLRAGQKKSRVATSEHCILAVTTDSRALSNNEAEQLTRDALTHLMDAGIDRVFLKIDSTMRGSIPGQITGALAAWRSRHDGARAIVCPAYPRMGRTVERGRLFVHGEPVEQTAIGRDPVTPVTTSDMHALIPASPSITIADAASDEALSDLATVVAEAGPSVIAVGSGGFAEALAAVLTGRSVEPVSHAVKRLRPTDGGRILLLVTSLNPVSHAQVARLRDCFPDVAVVLAPATRVGGRSVADMLATEFAELIDRERWDLVGLIGGDGARAALNRLGASGIRIVDSLVEGIPFGFITGGRADGLPVFTKAGGFGTEDALVKTVQRARESARGET